MLFDTKRIYKKYISGGKKPEDEANLKETSSFVSDLIADTKSSHFQNLGKRLNDPLTRPKTYWSILKKLLNKAKIPSVPPLLVNDTFVTDFREKAGIFNVFFANQCNILDNASILPEVSYKTNKRFSFHLDYADVIYDQPHNESFCSKIESIQYNAALAITGAFSVLCI